MGAIIEPVTLLSNLSLNLSPCLRLAGRIRTSFAEHMQLCLPERLSAERQDSLPRGHHAAEHPLLKLHDIRELASPADETQHCS
jgi:hypothetical protein